MTAPAVHVFEHRLVSYRRTFRGSLFSSFLQPALFLTAMGVGLGALVNRPGNAALAGDPACNPGCDPDWDGLLRADRRLQRDPGKCGGLQHALPLRHQPAVPVLGDLLSRRSASGAPPADRLRDTALPRACARSPAV